MIRCRCTTILLEKRGFFRLHGIKTPANGAFSAFGGWKIGAPRHFQATAG
jgi:hypothetical protein